MKQEVIWTWAAEADLQRFFAAEEDQCEGRGLSLITQVEKATDLLASFPLMAPKWRPPVRRLILRRRHLCLFYVPESRGVVVIGVANLRSDPDQILREIRSRLP